MKKKRSIIAVLALLLIAVGGGLYAWQNTKADIANSAIKQKKNSRSTIPYSIQLLSGKSYVASNPLKLQLSIRDKTGQVFRAFDNSDQYTLMLIAIRKDRTNFQHLHPVYNKQTGIFTIPDFQFPADGEYRLFAQFVAANAPKSANGTKTVSAPYIDVMAGSKSKYVTSTPVGEKFVSSVDGFDTNVYFAGGDSPGSAPITYYTAGDVSTVAIEINKGGMPYKTLQTYRGSIGRIAAFGPHLEYVSANSEPETTGQQSGLIIFSVNFPNAGLYKLFMQTQADNRVSTFDYNVTVKAVPTTTPSKVRSQ